MNSQPQIARRLRVKICGLMQIDQAKAIAAAGVDALGFICVPESPRYLKPEAIHAIVTHLPALTPWQTPLAKIGVFANATLDHILSTVETASLTGVQLHGQESPELCRMLGQKLPGIELIKAFRVRDTQTLRSVAAYTDVVDTFLLDAYTQAALGGTGEAWDWGIVQDFTPGRPWLLAGGLTPNNLKTALQQTHPSGIDLSSGVEQSPGDKDLELVHAVLNQVFSDRAPQASSL